MSIQSAMKNVVAAIRTPPPAVADGKHELARPADFFKAAKALTGSLNQVQVDTINAMFGAASHWPIGWMAYALATAWHECRLEPIREKGGRQYLSKYDTGNLARALGNTPAADGDGILYAGRGLVQLTGRTNYERAGAMLRMDLLGNPDLALVPVNAVRILAWGMEGGHFTGKKLGTYLRGWRGTNAEFVEARRIINGKDRAAQIAAYAERFQSALEEGGWA